MRFLNVIGSDVWTYTSGRWMKLPIAMPQLRTALDYARKAGTSGNMNDYKVVYLGPAVVQGVPTSDYRLTGKSDSKPVEMWIGANHLPVQIEADSEQGPMYMIYSKYNAAADITPPF